MIHLAREINVTSFDIQATVAIGRERPEFLAVARLAADLEQPLGTPELKQHLLGPLPEVACRKVLERCVALGLLERHGERGESGALSPAGRLALERNQVLVPEEGVWRFFLLDDPLTSAPLVHALRLEPERARKAARGPRSEQPAPRPAPRLLQRCRESAVPLPSLYDGKLLQLIDMADKGTAGPGGKLRVELQWSEQGCEVHLSGRLSNDQDGVKQEPLRLDARPAPGDAVKDWSLEQLWRALVLQATGVSGPELDHWCRATGGLAVPTEFDLQLLPEAACHSFRLDLAVPASKLPGLGSFEPTTLKDVALVPRSDAAAQAWQDWLQWHGIDDYVTPTQIDERARALGQHFPHHRPQPRSAAELLASALSKRPDARSRFLLAPADLGLWS